MNKYKCINTIPVEDISSWKEKFEVCCYSSRLLSKLYGINKQARNKIDFVEIRKAIYYAKKYHGAQRRDTGEPYYSHPLEVAYKVSDYLFKTDIIVTSILHDTLEDTDMTFEMIKSIFSPLIANKVLDLTRISKNGQKMSSAETAELLFKQKKYEVLGIKLFDRLHNMQTIDANPPEKRGAVIKETLKYFLVLSEILELPRLANSLYEECHQANMKLGLLKGNNFIFDKHFNFYDSPTSQNKIH